MKSGRSAVGHMDRALLLLLGAFLLGVAVLSFAKAASDVRPLPATVTVVPPSRALPAALAGRQIEVRQKEPLAFHDLLARVAGALGVEATVEERPGRIAGEHVVLDPPAPFGLVMTGTVPAVLDELARRSGHDWTWAQGRLVFFRHADSEQRAALSPRQQAGIAADGKQGTAGHVLAGRSVSGGFGRSGAGQDTADPPGWEVDPARHGTVEGVLRAWAERAGWQVAWETERRFEVGAAAVFEGTADEQESFLKAADALLAIRPMRRLLSVTAYPNRWLVVRDIGSAVP